MSRLCVFYIHIDALCINSAFSNSRPAHFYVVYHLAHLVRVEGWTVLLYLLNSSQSQKFLKAASIQAVCGTLVKLSANEMNTQLQYFITLVWKTRCWGQFHCELCKADLKERVSVFYTYSYERLIFQSERLTDVLIQLFNLISNCFFSKQHV